MSLIKKIQKAGELLQAVKMVLILFLIINIFGLIYILNIDMDKDKLQVWLLFSSFYILVLLLVLWKIGDIFYSIDRSDLEDDIESIQTHKEVMKKLQL